jgi:hypothetical protein
VVIAKLAYHKVNCSDSWDHVPFRSCPLEPGFLHIDIKNLPLMPDETARRYLFVAIDRATRWVYIEIYAKSRIEAMSGRGRNWLFETLLLSPAPPVAPIEEIQARR